MTAPDFRTPALDALAQEIIPAQHFEFSAATARDRFFNDTRMLDVKQWVHNAFRTNPTSMLDHMTAHLALTGTENLLDLGCGNGFVLEHLRPHLAGGSITGLDIAPAVLDAARDRLRGTATACTWIEGSADDLSMLGDDTFDRVMANYMIHYVPDLDRCFTEVRRVMRPGGIFQLTTDRTDSMLEMYQVHFAALTAMAAPQHLFKASPKGRLSLTNGADMLGRHFEQVDTVTWQDQLRFTDPEPFMRFYETGHNHCCASSEEDEHLTEDFFAELRDRVRAQVTEAIVTQGYFAVTKFTGSFSVPVTTLGGAAVAAVSGRGALVASEDAAPADAVRRSTERDLMPPTIRRAVIPAAGLGSRLLPLTKATPKEMLPVGDKPVIEHTVRELVASGITDITIVVSGGKSLIQDHFRPNPALVEQLRADGKTAYADAVEEIGELARQGHITYLDQHGPYGNGTPVLNAARNFGEEPMLVLWPDDVFVADMPRAQQLIRAYEATNCPVLALMPMNPADSRRYGVPVVKEDLDNGLLRITGLVEKPKPADAPSAYAAIGGYVVTPGIVEELREQTSRWYERREGEVYLTDAINAYAATRAVYGQVISGRWYDTGNPADYLVAQMAFALSHPDYGPILRRLARELGDGEHPAAGPDTTT